MAAQRLSSKRYIETSLRKGNVVMKRMLCVVVWFSLCVASFAQGRGQRGAQPAKTIAPIDLTGYWVSVVSEDWRHRMMTPRKGDFESLPLTPEGIRVANAWDLTKDDQA